MNWNEVLSIDSYHSLDRWFFRSSFFNWFEYGSMYFWDNMERNVSDLSNFKSFNVTRSFWNDSRSFMSRFWGLANWNISYSFDNDWFNSFVFNWDEVLSIDSDDSFDSWFFWSNFFCWFKCRYVYFWNYVKWDVSDLSNLESFNVTRSFWNDSRSFMSRFWGLANWNISYSFDNDWFNSFVFNWDEVLSIDSDDSFDSWFFWSNFFCWFECSSLNFWDNIKWNISDLSNFESFNVTGSLGDDSRSFMSRFWSCMHWNIGDSFNNNWFHSFIFNWNVVLSINSNHSLDWWLFVWNWNFFGLGFFDNWFFKIMLRLNRHGSSNYILIDISFISWLDWHQNIFAISFQNRFASTLDIIFNTSAKTLVSLSMALLNAKFILGLESVGMNELRDVFINFIIREAVDFALIDWIHIT